ncbi:MAG: hypothetical protein L0H29_08325, partial [Sinobacteraceae bacterium]|nr:hypothetical protein [Nevskiaceae bacterium]
MTAAHLIPLLDLSNPEAPLIRHGDTLISRARFAAAVLELAARLPTRGRVLNACQTRLGFCIALAASALAGRTCLLTGHDGLHGFALPPDGDITVLSEGVEADITVPTALPAQGVTTLPTVPTDRVVAVVHTSGSTGQPQAHAKTWHALWHAGRQ